MSTMGLVSTLNTFDSAAVLVYDFEAQVFRVNGEVKKFSDVVYFARGSSASQYNSKGVMETAPAGQPRFDYDPITKAVKGLLLESQRVNYIKDSEFSTLTQHWSKAPGVISGDPVLAPDGTLTGRALSNTPGVGSCVNQPAGAPEGVNTYSVFCKAKDSLPFSLFFEFGNGLGGTVQFNAAAKVFNGGSPISTSYEEVGNDWLRIAITTNSNKVAFYIGAYGATSLLNSGYVWGFQVEQGAYATSYIPTRNSLTTRSTPATLFNNQGVLVTVPADSPRTDSYAYDASGQLQPAGQLLEASATNLLRRGSEWLNAAPWVTAGGSAVPGSIGPDSRLSATSLIETTGSITGSREVRQAGISVTSGSTYTLSVFVKPLLGSAARRVRVGFGSGSIVSSGVAQGIFDLSTKSVISAVSAVAAVQIMADGWCRLSITVTVENTTSVPVYFTLLNGNRDVYVGDGVSGIDLFGPQMEVGTSLSSYIPAKGSFTSRSTSATSVNEQGGVVTHAVNESRDNAYGYNASGKLTAVGTLLEAAATNLLLYSADLSKAAWVPSQSAAIYAPVITKSSTQAPDLSSDAFDIAFNAPASADVSSVSQNFNSTVGNAYASGLWIKAKSAKDVGKKVILRNTTGYKVITLTDKFVREDRWETASTTTQFIRLTLAPQLGSSAGLVECTVWGAQAEVGRYLTSYIPTQAAQVTRAADVYVSNAVTRAADVYSSTPTTRSSDFAYSDTPSTWFNQKEGTLIVQGVHTKGSTGNRHILGIQGSTVSDWLAMRSDDANKIQVGAANTSGSATTTMSGFVIPDSTEFKCALRYALDNSAFSVNGAAVQPDASCTWPAVVPYNKMLIGTYAQGNAVMGGWIKKVAYFDKAIPSPQTQIISA